MSITLVYPQADSPRLLPALPTDFVPTFDTYWNTHTVGLGSNSYITAISLLVNTNFNLRYRFQVTQRSRYKTTEVHRYLLCAQCLDHYDNLNSGSIEVEGAGERSTRKEFHFCPGSQCGKERTGPFEEEADRYYIAPRAYRVWADEFPFQDAASSEMNAEEWTAYLQRRGLNLFHATMAAETLTARLVEEEMLFHAYGALAIEQNRSGRLPSNWLVDRRDSLVQWLETHEDYMGNVLAPLYELSSYGPFLQEHSDLLKAHGEEHGYL